MPSPAMLEVHRTRLDTEKRHSWEMCCLLAGDNGGGSGGEAIGEWTERSWEVSALAPDPVILFPLVLRSF